jgi:hypothetical protein
MAITEHACSVALVNDAGEEPVGAWYARQAGRVAFDDEAQQLRLITRHTWQWPQGTPGEPFWLVNMRVSFDETLPPPYQDMRVVDIPWPVGGYYRGPVAISGGSIATAGPPTP